ncbi:GNAT family N-acetyltransferase [Kordia sp.]|uniref:GNAT family N-acetyltransferase n=1 Tax=Kordia sp. TaxID=1965332 RepID=UPI003D6BEAD8
MDYHQDRFKDHSLLLYKKDKLVAVFPANQRENVLYSHQGLTYGGLVINENLKLKDVAACLKVILDYLKENEIQKVQVKLLPSIYSPLPTDELKYLFFILEARLARRDALSVVNMQHRPKISKDRIAGKKRAVKHGLVIKEVNTFDEFWNEILIPNLERKHAAKPVHSLAEIQKLKNHFPNKIRQFNVYKDNVIVAGTTIFETEFVAHSQYISGNEDKNNLGSLDFLHLYLLDEVFQDKMYFDFGISNENQGKNINGGLHYWKEGFGARTITQDFYEIDVQQQHKLDTIFI